MSASRSGTALTSVALISVLLAACGGGGSDSPSSGQTSSTGSGSSDTSGGTSGGSTSSGGTGSVVSSQPYVGFFYNTNVKTGGLIGADLKVDSGSITGVWDFTQDDAESIVLCGAGSDLKMTRTDSTHSGIFTSADHDAGCGFDAGQVFTLNGINDSGALHLAGVYGVKGVDTGFYDVWQGGPADVLVCSGTVSTSANGSEPASSAQAVMSVYVGSYVIWGYLSAQNHDIATGNPISCVTEGTTIGIRNEATGEIGFKYIATGRSGADCTSSTLGQGYFTGTYAGTSGIRVSEPGVGDGAASFVLDSCSVKKVTPSGAPGFAGLKQALKANLRSFAR